VPCPPRTRTTAEGCIGPWVSPPSCVAFAAYRLGTVRARRYPASKAFFQVGAGVLFFTLLLPHAKTLYEASPGGGLEILLEDSNPHVRAIAAEMRIPV